MSGLLALLIIVGFVLFMAAWLQLVTGLWWNMHHNMAMRHDWYEFTRPRPRFYWFSFGDWGGASSVFKDVYWERVFLTRRHPKPIPPGGELRGHVEINTTSGTVVETSRWTPIIRTRRT